MTDIRSKLTGVFAPAVTPFFNERLVLKDLRYNLKKLNQTELTGYLSLGSNGEYKSLTDKEQLKVLEIFAEEKENKIVMVGCGCESTHQTIEKCNLAGKFGFDFVSVLTPSYFAKQMDGDILKGYFQKVADTSPLPVLIYNAPGFAGGVQIPPKTIERLSHHPNIVGIKDSSPSGPAGLLSLLDPNEEFHVMAGSINFFYPALHLGAVGGIVSLANALPQACHELYHLFKNNRFDKANTLHRRLSKLNAAISGTYGVAGVKAAMDITGYRGGEPRHPLRPLNKEDINMIRDKILTEHFSIA